MYAPKKQKSTSRVSPETAFINKSRKGAHKENIHMKYPNTINSKENYLAVRVGETRTTA